MDFIIRIILFIFGLFHRECFPTTGATPVVLCGEDLANRLIRICTGNPIHFAVPADECCQGAQSSLEDFCQKWWDPFDDVINIIVLIQQGFLCLPQFWDHSLEKHLQQIPRFIIKMPKMYVLSHLFESLLRFLNIIFRIRLKIPKFLKKHLSCEVFQNKTI